MARPGTNGGKQRVGAKTWAPEAADRPAGLFLPDGIADAAGWLRGLVSQWAAAEVAPGRLIPWLPVAFGLGLVGYFTADREPAWWAASMLAVAGIAAACVAHRRPVGFPLALGFAAFAAGLATATLQTARIAHPILQHPIASASLAGFVEIREEREKSDRIVVRVQRFDASPAGGAPDRVRVAVKKGSAPAVGSFVELKAHLSPPLQPLRPGGYDFARDMYFQRIGASGYALGAIRPAAAPSAPGLRLRVMASVDAMRETINTRIHAVLPGDRGSIASALITGKRGALSAPVADAFYVSSLAHVLAISGFHMAVVAGIAFFFIRAILALVPSLASRRPIKKWAAAGALATAAYYLVLSGASVSTQRSFIMIAIVLIGVMLDRAALTLRTISVAAFGVLLFTPEAIVHPSFQMSFAATLALIGPTNMDCQAAYFGAPSSTRRSSRAPRCGACARSPASRSPRSSPGSPPSHMPPTISTASHLTACSPICWPCRWFRPS
jgi:competence protein ComEC